MPKTNVVHSLKPNRLNQGGDTVIEYMSGNAKIIIDESYIQNRTPEQYQADYERLQEAAWAIIDELAALGEEV